ncbi:MAG: hypothetical protein Q8M08_05670 [Bacteroidales bacterium]|nr:hypothetical protein [Bacteroidales bacterium]
MPNHIHGLLIIDNVETRQCLVSTTGQPATGDIETRQCLVSTTGQPATGDIETRRCLVSTGDSIDSNNKTIGSKRFRNPGKNNISSVIGSFKSICTKTIHKQFPEINFAWQPRFHDHIVRNNLEYRRIQQYIIDNPIHWNKDKFYCNEPGGGK